jgi:WD40 repeat protein
LVATLTNPRVTHSLAFSPDGHVLAAGHSAGLRVWRKSGGNDWRLVSARTSDNFVYGVSFRKDGILAATNGNQIWLYNKHFRLIKSTRVHNATRGMMFSPDGTKLVVSDADSPAIAILDGRTLDLVKMLQKPGRLDSNDNMSSVTWSRDGRYVFAGGRYQEKSDNKLVAIVRRWDVVNDGPTADFRALGNIDTVQDLAPFGQSGVLVLSSDPLVGAYDEKGDAVFSRGPVHHELWTFFSGPDDGLFRVSRDGGVIEVPSAQGVSRQRLSEFPRLHATSTQLIAMTQRCRQQDLRLRHSKY